LTVEVLTTLGEQGIDLLPKIHTELVQMGVVSPEATCMYSKVEALPGGFDLPTPELQTALEQQAGHASENLGNTTLLCRARGMKFFTDQVLIGLFHEISSI